MNNLIIHAKYAHVESNHHILAIFAKHDGLFLSCTPSNFSKMGNNTYSSNICKVWLISFTYMSNFSKMGNNTYSCTYRLVLKVDLYYRSTCIILVSEFPRLLIQVDLYYSPTFNPIITVVVIEKY